MESNNFSTKLKSGTYRKDKFVVFSPRQLHLFMVAVSYVSVYDEASAKCVLAFARSYHTQLH